MISLHYLWDLTYSFETRYQSLVLKLYPVNRIVDQFRKVCDGKVLFSNVIKQKYLYSYLFIIIMLWKGKFNLKNKNLQPNARGWTGIFNLINTTLFLEEAFICNGQRVLGYPSIGIVGLSKIELMFSYSSTSTPK